MRTPVKGILVACVLAMFSIGAYAQTKVVVIPMFEEAPTKKTIFVTSTTYTGDLVQAANNLPNLTGITDGLTAGDALCQSRADAAGLGGTYKAWLSTASSDAIRMLSETAGPWYRADGVKVADNKAEFASGTLQAPINRTEYAQPPDAQSGNSYPSFPWTGTHGDGARADNTSDWTCKDWTSDSDTDNARYGNVTALNSGWTSDSDGSCGSAGGGESPIYCLEY